MVGVSDVILITYRSNASFNRNTIVTLQQWYSVPDVPPVTGEDPVRWI